MFGLEESFRCQVDSREPYEKIYLEANGGIDLEGEWIFSGSYSIKVKPKDVDNFFHYEGRIYKGYKPKSRWRIDLRVCGGEYNRITLLILQKTATSIKKAQMMILEAIQQFECSDRYVKELAPRIYAEDNRCPIVKEIEGQLFWIATTWDGAYSAIDSKRQNGENYALGAGKFFYRKRKWEFEYPLDKDGKRNYDSEPEKVYLPPVYGGIDIKYYSTSSSSKEASLRKGEIDHAIFNLSDEQLCKIQQLRYFDITKKSFLK